MVANTHAIPEGPTTNPSELDETLRTRLDALCAEGWDIWDRFERDVRDRRFHPFIAAEYEVVCEALMRHRAPGLRFLEWGSASGVITIMADLMGFDACGIELDAPLVATSRELAARFQSGARFVTGSFLPTGYRWRSSAGDEDMRSIGTGESGYLQIGSALDEFDVVFGYPWGGEINVMLDVMKRYGRSDALLLLHDIDLGVRAFRGGREVNT